MHHYENDVPFEVPQGWVWCTLDDICLISGRIGFRGYTKEDLVEQGKGAITLSPSNIIDGCMNYDKCTYISWSKYEESPEIKVNNYDILLVKTGSSFGKCALVTELPLQATINPQFVVLKRVTIHRSYLTYALQSQYAHKIYDEFVLGTAIPTFTQVALGNMEIPIPPFTEQQRIVEEVERWFKLIDIIEQGKVDLQTTIKQAKSKILDLAIHGKLVQQNPNDEPASELLKRINPKAQITCDNEHSRKLPKGWYNTTLANMCNTTNGLWKGKKPPFVKVGVIRNANFTKYFTLDYSKIEYIDVEQRAFEKKHLLHGDLIVEKSGGSDKNPVGRAIFFDGEDGLFSFSNFTMCLRCKDQTTLMSKYLFYLLLCIYSRGDMVAMQTQTTGLHNLLVEKFMAMTFPLPPFAEQKRIVQKIEELFSLLDCIEKALQA